MKTIPISLLKRNAKIIKKEKNIKYLESLDIIAKEQGFYSWNELIDNSILIMNYKTIEKLGIAKNKLYFFIYSMVESLKDINYIFNKNDPIITSNYLNSKFNSSYETTFFFIGNYKIDFNCISQKYKRFQS